MRRSIQLLVLLSVFFAISPAKAVFIRPFPQHFNDEVLWFYDNGDNSKRLMFELNGLTTDTTRIWTIPDRNLDLGNPIFDSMTVDDIKIDGENIENPAGDIYVKGEDVFIQSKVDDEIHLQTGGDTDDYVIVELYAPDRPQIRFVGCDGIIVADGGDILFGNENLHTTGNLIDDDGNSLSIGDANAAYNIARTHGNYRMSWVGNSILVDPMDDTTGWTPTNATLAYDTDNYRCGATNFRSIKFTKTDAATWSRIEKTISATDLSDAHCAFRIYVHEGSGNSAYTRIEYLSISLYDSLGNYVSYYLFKGVGNTGYFGWYDLECILNGEHDYASETPADLTDIVKIRFNIGTTSSVYIPSVTFDRLEFYKPKNTTGFIIFRIDAGYELQWDAIAYLESKCLTSGSRKLRIAMMIRQQYFGGVGELTLQQLKDLQDMGHEVGIYTGNLSGVSLADAIIRVEAEQDWLAENGLGRGIRYGAHGTAANFNNKMRTVLTNARFDAVFCGPGLYGNLHPHTLWDTRYLYWSHFLTTGTTVSATRLANTAATKGLFVYGAHVADAGELAQFKTDIDVIVPQINKGKLIPITVHELVFGLNDNIVDIKQERTITADDTTPDVSGGNVFITSANTVATAITDLDNPTPHQIITLIGGSNADSSTIDDAGNFNLSAAWTASLDDTLTLYVQADNDYIELSRTNN